MPTQEGRVRAQGGSLQASRVRCEPASRVRSLQEIQMRAQEGRMRTAEEGETVQLLQEIARLWAADETVRRDRAVQHKRRHVEAQRM